MSGVNVVGENGSHVKNFKQFLQFFAGVTTRVPPIKLHKTSKSLECILARATNYLFAGPLTRVSRGSKKLKKILNLEDQ